MLHDEGNIDDPNLPTAASRRALSATLRLVSNELGRVGPAAAAVTMGNVALTNGRSMVLAHLNEPLRLRRLTVANERGEHDRGWMHSAVCSWSPAAMEIHEKASRTSRRSTRCSSRATSRSRSPISRPSWSMVSDLVAEARFARASANSVGELVRADAGDLHCLRRCGIMKVDDRLGVRALEPIGDVASEVLVLADRGPAALDDLLRGIGAVRLIDLAGLFECLRRERLLDRLDRIEIGTCLHGSRIIDDVARAVVVAWRAAPSETRRQPSSTPITVSGPVRAGVT